MHRPPFVLAVVFLGAFAHCASPASSPTKVPQPGSEGALPSGTPVTAVNQAEPTAPPDAKPPVNAEVPSPPEANSPIEERPLSDDRLATEGEEEPEPVEYQEGGSEDLIDRVLRLHGEEFRVVVAQPREGKPITAKLRVAGKGKALKIGFRKGSYADLVQVVGAELPAFSGKRVAMIQIFLESGEDSFSRNMVTALIFVGDDKRPAKVLWQGEGSYQNYGGECEKLNVISFVPVAANAAKVLRHREVLTPADGEAVNGDAKACVAKAKTLKAVARVKIP